MILVADSGSTKADWSFQNKSGENIFFSTRGMNPFFHDQKFINNELLSNDVSLSVRYEVKKLYFFGAGCSSPDRNEIIKIGLSGFFTNAEIIVEHDMLGCALSVCNGKPGLACILGTGSNIAYFNGKTILGNRHGLGYILGDEGSGSYFGKIILKYYIYKLLPKELETAFNEKYQLTKENIIDSVYNQPDPNVFLASFARFLSDHKSADFIKKMIYDGINDFFETNIKSYPESREVPVHFVGSIAYNFKDTIFEVAKNNNITVGTIIQKPINGLAAYFFNGGKMP